MEPEEFRHWRKSLGWKQKDAAERLGLKKRVIQYYEKGDRDGKSVSIPRSVELACLALALGHDAFDAEIAARAIESRSSAASDSQNAPGETADTAESGKAHGGSDEPQGDSASA